MIALWIGVTYFWFNGAYFLSMSLNTVLVCYQKSIFVFLNQNICCWYSMKWIFYHDLQVMTLDSFNALTVTVNPQSLWWKYRGCRYTSHSEIATIFSPTKDTINTKYGLYSLTAGRPFLRNIIPYFFWKSRRFCKNYRLLQSWLHGALSRLSSTLQQKRRDKNLEKAVKKYGLSV